MRTINFYSALVLVLGGIAALALEGCSQAPTPPAVASSSSPPTAAPVEANTNSVQGFSLPSTSRSEATGFSVYGSSPSVNIPTTSAVPKAASNGISFNFVNADVSDVAHTIFGELLKQNYTVDGGVQGTITLQTTQPIPPEAVIPALETSLKMDNLALIQEADGYHIAPMANAPAEAADNLSVAGGVQTPGYGYEIIPLKYASADAVVRLIQPLAQNGVQIQADDTRNLIIVAGTSQDRAAIAQNIAVFDVDWLSGMSYAMVPLQHASARVVSKEVEDFIGGENSPMTGLVRLVVIGQLNSILVITRQPQYLSEVRDLIEKFDEQTETIGRQVYIYHLQNGDAKNVASLLNQLIGQGSALQNTAESTSSDQDSSDDTSGTPSSSTAMPDTGSGITNGGQGGLPMPQIATPQANSSATSVDNDSQAGSTIIQDNSDNSSDDAPPKITADEDDNNLLIYATPDQYQSIQEALVQLDVQPRQVMLEAAVAEVDLTGSLSYGVQYFFQSGRVQSENTLGSTSAVAPAFPGFSALLSPGQNIQIALDALENITHVNVLSAPKLLVLNNQPAELDVGQEVPILSQTAQSTVTSNSELVDTVQYQNTGVILHVTPRISDGGLVTLDISQEVSEVSQTTSSTLNSPTISERKLATIVAVPDGQTVALGGMIQDDSSKGNSGIPFLDRIPGLGALFSNQSNSDDRTELLILITPHVVQTDGALQDVTDELRRQVGEAGTMQ